MTIHYRVTYGSNPLEREIVRVTARTVNTGFAKVLTIAREPLGNGQERDIIAIELVKVER